MDRRKLLKSLMAAPIAAIIPASAGATEWEWLSGQPDVVTMMPNVASTIPGETSWIMVERVKSVLRGGGKGGGPPEFVDEMVYYAVHPEHNTAIDLTMWGNRLPEDDELDKWVRYDAEEQSRLDERLKDMRILDDDVITRMSRERRAREREMKSHQLTLAGSIMPD